MDIEFLQEKFLKLINENPNAKIVIIQKEHISKKLEKIKKYKSDDEANFSKRLYEKNQLEDLINSMEKHIELEKIEMVLLNQMCSDIYSSYIEEDLDDKDKRNLFQNNNKDEDYDLHFYLEIIYKKYCMNRFFKARSYKISKYLKQQKEYKSHKGEINKIISYLQQSKRDELSREKYLSAKKGKKITPNKHRVHGSKTGNRYIMLDIVLAYLNTVHFHLNDENDDLLLFASSYQGEVVFLMLSNHRQISNKEEILELMKRHHYSSFEKVLSPIDDKYKLIENIVDTDDGDDIGVEELLRENINPIFKINRKNYIMNNMMSSANTPSEVHELYSGIINCLNRHIVPICKEKKENGKIEIDLINGKMRIVFKDYTKEAKINFTSRSIEILKVLK